MVFLDVLSSSSNFTSSNGASTVLLSSTFGTHETRNRLARDEMDGFRVLVFESRLNLGELANVGDEMMVGEVPPISKDRRYPCNSTLIRRTYLEGFTRYYKRFVDALDTVTRFILFPMETPCFYTVGTGTIGGRRLFMSASLSPTPKYRKKRP
jgi:hypothetical protein